MYPDIIERTRGLWRASRGLGRLGVGILAIWDILCRGMAMADPPVAVVHVLAVLPRTAHGDFLKPFSLGWVWHTGRFWGAHGTISFGDRSISCVLLCLAPSFGR